MDYIDFINKCESGSVYSIKEPILCPCFLKALLFEKAEAILFVSHSISTKSMAKSLYDICSKEELSVLTKMPIFFALSTRAALTNWATRWVHDSVLGEMHQK